MSEARIGSSFRDPSGFLFTRDGLLLRQVQERYRRHYEHLKSSGLHDTLVSGGLMVPHDERPLTEAYSSGAAFVLRPERVPFVSMPYEWTFGQRRAAAILTLRVQELALAHGMSLKDASAFNVQFRGVRPVFVDTLSFEIREDGAPWVAYRQFCQHFLAPLALQARVDVRLGHLLRQHLDGIPLDLASKLIPKGLQTTLWQILHIHLHARSIARHASTATAERGKSVSPRKVTLRGIEGIVSNLADAVAGLDWTPEGTEWGTYEQTLGYDQADRQAKHRVVGDLVRASGARTLLDLGANAGEYSRVARSAGAEYVVAVDGDPMAVERAFRRLTAEGDIGILPLWMDLSNPSPAQGWGHGEWPSLVERGPFDAVMALALVHHLAIGNNVPLASVALELTRLGRQVIIEWVPKGDPQVQRLLSAREDIFDRYTEEELTRGMVAAGFTLQTRAPIGDSGRILCHFAR